jgi:hypothetical protein
MSFLHNCDPICINVIFASIWYLACNLLFNLDSELSLNYDFTLILQFKCAGWPAWDGDWGTGGIPGLRGLGLFL